MRGTIPIVSCDHEECCDKWMIDHYSIGVMEWRELLDGWKYDAYRYDDDALCPEHARAGDPA
jgi:hypothetical protein